MEITPLKYFLEVARTEHVTNSARTLNIAQPALTQAIHRLEREVGAPLFERSGRNIRLTPAGAYLRDRIGPAVADLDAAIEDARAFASKESSVVTVGIFAASSIVIDAIAAYTAHNPGITFRITQNHFDAACDISVAAERTGGQSPRCITLTERIGVAVPHDSAFGGEVRLADLAEERFICLAGSRRFRETCDRLCAEHAFVPHIGFESDSPAAVKKIIGLGMGVGFWPEHSWGSLADSRARFVFLAEKESRRSITIAREKRRQPKKEADAFFGFLVSYLESLWEGQTETR